MIHDPDPTGFGRPTTADGSPTAAQDRTQGGRRHRPRPVRYPKPGPDRALLDGIVFALGVLVGLTVVVVGFGGMAIAVAAELGWIP